MSNFELNKTTLQDALDTAYNFKLTDTHAHTDIAYKEWRDKFIDDYEKEENKLYEGAALSLARILSERTKLEEIVGFVRTDLLDLRYHGCRHDINPITRMNMNELERLGWAIERFKSMDEYVKSYALSVLNKIEIKLGELYE